MPEHPKNFHYVLRQRARAFGIWPTDTAIETEWIPHPIKTDLGETSSQIKIVIRTYQSATDEQLETGAGSERTFDGVSLHKPDVRNVFNLGGEIFSPSNQSTTLRIVGHRPKLGELDFCLEFLSPVPLSEKILYRDYARFLCPLVFGVAFAAGDTIAIQVEPQLEEIIDAKTFESTGRIRIRSAQRPNLSGRDASSALEKAFRGYDKLGLFDSKHLQIATKRFLQARSEHDPVDRYCDFWEACEFATGGMIGHVDARIASMLFNIFNINKNIIRSKIVRPLYQIRKDLVHHGLDHLDDFAESLSLLEITAECLLASLIFGSKDLKVVLLANRILSRINLPVLTP